MYIGTIDTDPDDLDFLRSIGVTIHHSKPEPSNTICLTVTLPEFALKTLDPHFGSRFIWSLQPVTANVAVILTAFCPPASSPPFWQDNIHLEGDTESQLNHIFSLLNTNPPLSYPHRSLSVGDIVILKDSTFKCLTIGWQHIS